MRYIKGFYMAMGMFTGIPLPFHIWDEKLTSVMVSVFPLVGVIVGGVWWLAAVLLTFLNIPLIITAAFLTVVPFFVAGFIHLDGYMDTNDALLSWRPMEDKLRILVDPRVGAFSVVMLAIVFLLQFAAMHEVANVGEYFALVIAISIISRCCSAFSIFTLRQMPQSNYGTLLKQSVRLSHKIFIFIVAIGIIIASFFYAGFLGLGVSAAVVLGYATAIRHAFKGFDGISGDLLGYALVISELCGLIAFAVLQGRWVF